MAIRKAEQGIMPGQRQRNKQGNRKGHRKGKIQTSKQ